MTGSDAHGKVLAKVAALLAKAESSTFEAEQLAFLAKAQELITRHAIDVALLDLDGGRSAAPGSRHVAVVDPYASGKAALLSAVAHANRCRAVWSRQEARCTVVGFDGDLDAVELLFASLLVQATAAMARAGSVVDARGVSRTRSFRSSFLAAFAQRIGERLLAAAAAEVDAVAAGERSLLPVLAAREEAVEQALAEAFPRLGRFRAPAANGAGLLAGRLAADRADLAPGGAVERGRRSA